MIPTIPDVATKLAPLIRMLSSPIDGEPLGAARAIQRTFKAAGLDLHDLAHHVEPARPPALEAPCKATPRRHAHWRTVMQWRLDLDDICLRAKEWRFLRQLLPHWRDRPTAGQLAWLQRITDELGIPEAPE